NKKRHQFTLITDGLSTETATFAAGKQAVLLNDIVDFSPLLLAQLSDAGIRFIVAGCASSSQDDVITNAYGIKVALINKEPVNGISATELTRFAAVEAIRIFDIWDSKQNDQNQ